MSENEIINVTVETYIQSIKISFKLLNDNCLNKFLPTNELKLQYLHFDTQNGKCI